jgi:hypothetical protein
MKISKLSLGLAAAALATAPAIAQVAMTPSVAPLSGEESEIGDAGAVILGLLAAGAIVAGIVSATSADEAELPVSG